MGEYISNATWSLDRAGGYQVRRNLEHDLRLDAELNGGRTATPPCTVLDQLLAAVQICGQEGIPLPLVMREVDAALVAIPEAMRAEWQANLHLCLVDRITAAFAKGRLQPRSPVV